MNLLASPDAGDEPQVVPDRVFDEPRLAAVYDQLDHDRSDLDAYVSIARRLRARSAVDIGCGTGTFACLLVADGLDVVGVDPAAAMLAVARAKPGADAARWIHGVATDLPSIHADLVTMTANVAQVFLDDDDWIATLGAAHRVLERGGTLVFETRRPERQAWLEWNPDDSLASIDVPGIGVVRSWYEVLDVSLPFVTFRATIAFERDGDEVTSDSTLRFRSQDEVERSLEQVGFRVEDVRDAPDRPGRELVFIASRRPDL